MPADGPPVPNLDAWGIAQGYHDVFGRWQAPSHQAAAAIRTAMGAVSNDPSEQPPAEPLLHLVRGDDPLPHLEPDSVVVLEDGAELAAADLPPSLPLGYHRVRPPDGDDQHLIVTPASAALPDDLRAWGVTVQLYAARSRGSWGIGDLTDLGRLIEWGEQRGIGTLGLNPLHASAPGAPPANSPYSPSSRRWHDPLYLDVADAAHRLGATVDPAANAAGRALNDGDRLDRSATWQLKLAELERLWATAGTPPEFEQFLSEGGLDLRRWGTYCAIAEVHGPSWTAWPAELRTPRGAAVTAFGDDRAARVRFWCALQWLFDQQLAATGAAGKVITDLAVGFAADGFDAWEWQDLVASGVRVGAPPDLLGPDGQDWGLPPFIPSRLRGVGYLPFAQTLRANLRHTRGLRIDHVMGLLRLFWIPPGMDATEGAFVRWSGTELIDIVALESARAGALVVGEDLGTVDDEIRTQLSQRGLLSTRLLWFEDDPPEQWPAQAMAAITTHDLPTVAGVWSGADLDDQQVAGVTVPEDGDAAFRHRLRVAAGCDDACPLEDLLPAVHGRMAAGPSMLATAALDDLMAARRRPNVPGTIDEHPNWRVPLPHPIEDLATLPTAEAIVDALRSTGR